MIIGHPAFLLFGNGAVRVLRFRGAPLSLVHRALFRQGCTCFRVHHAENVENKGFYAILVNAVISELVTIRTVLLLIRGVHQKIRRSL